MKKLKLIVILFSMIITYVCYAQSGWFWQNPLPQGNNLYSAHFINSNTIYLIGDVGTFSKTSNGGLNWSTDYCIGGFGGDYCKPIYTSKFLNSTTGFIATGYGMSDAIFRTSNAGMTWDSVTKKTYPAFKCMFFYGEDIGWACCSYGDYSSNINRILKTTNGGFNWFIQNTEIPTINSIYFINSNTGWFVGNFSMGYPVNVSANYIYKTVNGGDSYLNQLYSNLSENFKTVFFINENTGWVGGTKLYKTTDSGNSWSTLPIQINSIYFVNNTTGFCSNNSQVFKTTNSGTNWILVGLSDGNDISFIDDNTGFIAGNYGSILKTTNSGNSWNWLSQRITSNPITHINFVNSNTGFCIYHYWSYPPYPATILKTTNKGMTWNTSFSDNIHDLNDIFFVNDVTGWCAGDGGLIYKTTNSGINWFSLNSNINSTLNDIYFINQYTGWMISDTNIYSTVNGGNNWNTNSFNGLNFYNGKLIFINQNDGCIIGGNKIGVTTNGGINWVQTSNLSLNDFVKDEYNNLYSISLSRFYKSTDLGNNWQQISNPNKASVSIHMLNSTTGYLGCLRGILLKTTNSGVNWNVIKLPTNGQLRSLYVMDSSSIWVVGDGGLILSTVTSGELTNLNIQNLEIIPQYFSLSQNYPNPFNPQTKIKFELPSLTRSKSSIPVKLVIYDLLGREVATLVNEELKPGTYEADWDGSNYSSGVYFYKIILGDFTETKKMVLMK